MGISGLRTLGFAGSFESPNPLSGLTSPSPPPPLFLPSPASDIDPTHFVRKGKTKIDLISLNGHQKIDGVSLFDAATVLRIVFVSEEAYLISLKELVFQLVDREKYAVFLFGGRAKGRKGRDVDVDVDIGILGETAVPIDLMARLYEAVEESIIPLKVDFVDFSRVDDQFKQVALTEIEIWNQPSTIKISEKT